MAQVSGTSSTIFGTTAFGGGSPASGSLVTINPTTGGATVVWSLAETWSGGGCGAIDFHPTTGILYGICFDNTRVTAFGTGDSILVTINTGTGAITEIGPLGTGHRTMDMSFHPTTGILYAIGFENTFVMIELRTVNLTTGAATDVSGAEVCASTGPPCWGAGTVAASGNAMAFDTSGTLWVSNTVSAINSLWTLSITTEVATLIATGGGYPYIGYPASPPVFYRNNAGDFDPALNVFAVATNGGGGGPVDNHFGANSITGSGWTAPAGTSCLNRLPKTY